MTTTHQSPMPESKWAVIVEARFEVISICPSGTGFYIPGQEPMWELSHVEEWLFEIKPHQQQKSTVAKSPTPRTDSQAHEMHNHYEVVPAKIARELELELNEAKKDLSDYKSAYIKHTNELADVCAELKEVASIIDELKKRTRAELNELKELHQELLLSALPR